MRDVQRLPSAAILSAALVLAGAAVVAVLTSDASAGARARFAVMDALIVLVPVAVGVYATR